MLPYISKFGIYLNPTEHKVVRITSPYWFPEEPDWVYVTNEVNETLLNIRQLIRDKNLADNPDSVYMGKDSAQGISQDAKVKTINLGGSEEDLAEQALGVSRVIRFKEAASRRVPPALRYPAYRTYWLGTLASVSGFQMLTFGILWVTYELTQSPLFLGLCRRSERAARDCPEPVRRRLRGHVRQAQTHHRLPTRNCDSHLHPCADDDVRCAAYLLPPAHRVFLRGR